MQCNFIHSRYFSESCQNITNGTNVTFFLALLGGGQGRSQRGGAGADLEKSATKTGKIRKKWKEKGQIGKKMESLPGACPCGREGLATALAKPRPLTKNF